MKAGKLTDACRESAVSLRRPQLRDPQGRHRPLVADVDSFLEFNRPVLYLVPGMTKSHARRHSARLRRALRPAAAIPVHGERQGEPAVGQRVGPAKIPTNFRSLTCIVVGIAV